MGTTMRVDTRALRQARPAVDAVAASLDLIRRQLLIGLDAEGACWGDDDAGAMFSSAYEPAARQVTTALDTLRTGITHVSDALATVADRVDAADARAAARTAGA